MNKIIHLVLNPEFSSINKVIIVENIAAKERGKKHSFALFILTYPFS